MKNSLKFKLGILALSGIAVAAFLFMTNSEQRDDLLASDVESQAGILPVGPGISTLYILTEYFKHQDDISRNAGPLCEMSEAIITRCGTMGFITNLGGMGNVSSEVMSQITAAIKANKTPAEGKGELTFHNNNNGGFTASIGNAEIKIVFRDFYERYCLFKNMGYCETQYNGEKCMPQYKEATELLIKLAKGK